MVSLEIRQFLFGLPKQSLIFWEPEFLDLILSEHLQKAVTGKKKIYGQFPLVLKIPQYVNLVLNSALS